MASKIKIKTELPGPKAKELFENKFNKYMGLVALPYPFIYGGNGEGCYVHDADGNVFLDFVSQIAAQPLGYNHPRMVKVLERYVGKAPLKLAGHDFYPEEHAHMIEKIANITPEGLNCTFLVNSGAEAVENAMKICYRKRPAAKIAISIEGAFHGRTLGALSLTNSKAVHKKNYPELPVRHVPWSKDGIATVQAMENIVHRDVSPENIAFIIFEPIQGEGGYRIPEPAFFKRLEEFAKKHGIPLIADEIQSGMGRTGKWFAFQHFDIKPDLITMAKALQVGATITTQEMFPTEGGAISSTFGGGDLISMATGLEIIKIIEEENLLPHVEKMGNYLLKKLKELELKYPTFVKDARGLGLMCAIDVPDHDMQEKVVRECYERGLLLLGCGFNGLRFIPPYIVTEEEIDVAMNILESIIKCIVKK